MHGDETFVKQRALALWQEAHELHRRGNLRRAIDLYRRSIEIYPTAEAHTCRGWALSVLGQFDEAIEECKRAIAIDPDFGNPYNDIGSYLVVQGRLEEAIPWLEKAKAAPSYEPRHMAFMNLGRVYAAKKMYLRAIREFEAALALKPGDATCEAVLRELRGSLN